MAADTKYSEEDYSHFYDELEQAEQQAEAAEADLEMAEQRESNLTDAAARMDGDAELLGQINQLWEQCAEEKENAEAQLEDTRQQVQTMQDQLNVFIDGLNSETETLDLLESLGENVADSREILRYRMEIIETCKERLLNICDRLGIDYEEKAVESGTPGNASCGDASDRPLSHPPDLSDRSLKEHQKQEKQAALNALGEYMRSHNYGREDFETYSKDPEWCRLHQKAFPDLDLNRTCDPAMLHRYSLAKLTAYMYAHNYGPDDLSEYMRDPDWQQLHMETFPESLLPIKGFIKDINPKYTDFPSLAELPYCNNCGSCALAVEARLSGTDPNAVASTRNIGTNAKMELATGKKVVPSSPKEIEEILISRGAGSHMIVGINRTRDSGHWFNVFYDGKQFYTIDGQCGEILDWPYDYGSIANWEALI